MAHPQVGSSIPTKLSFAKIAAMPAPNITPALPNIIRENKTRPSNNTVQHVRSNSQVTPVQELQNLPKLEHKSRIEAITANLEVVSLEKSLTSDSHITPSGDSVADDQSQLSGSSLKQQSFDTKSMASVTTFAMDEKESIRPDDSASVRAVEEDDIHPGLSRNSSFQQEPEVQPSLSKTNVRMLAPSVTIAARRYPFTTLANPPRFGDLPVGPMPEPVLPQSHSSTESTTSFVEEPRTRPPTVATTTPDEKLLEALSSLKDRLPLLQLEEKILVFIGNNKDSMLELPPQNSFTRLLTHKLADYYNLAHHINDENNSVRIFRTDYCAVPISLAEIAKSVPVGSQPSHATQVKIMRRVQLGPRQFSAGNSTAASSSAPSKATSENGVEPPGEEWLQSPAEGTPSRDKSKLTREEREAQYKAARERIFGDFPEALTSESGSTGEASASMSRSSSSSGKKKPRKHNKTPKDDSFEARSSFIPSYTSMNMQPTYQQVYNDVQYPGGYNSSAYPPSPYGGLPSSNFSAYDPSLPYGNQMALNPGSGAIYSGTDGWQNQQQSSSSNFLNYQNTQPYQQQPLHPQLNNQYQQNSPSAMSQSPNWMPNQYQPMYFQNPQASNHPNWQAFNTGNMQSTMPYPYGQLPPQSHTSGVPFANQHPLPGSFAGTKSLFNPQTRSFIPSNTSARGGNRGGRKKGQNAGSTRTSGASSPAVSNLSENSHFKPKEDSLQQKYGTPANLPKKPPPPQVAPQFSNDLNNGGTGGPLIVNGNGKSSAS